MSEIPPQFTSYPRADSGGSSGSGAPIRPPGVYFKTIGEAWQIIQQDMATWILGGLIAGGIYLVTFLVFYALAFPLFKDVLLADQQSLDWQQLLKREGVSMLISLVPSGLFVTFMGGMYDMAIQRLDGYPIQATDVFSKMAKFPFFLGAYLLTSLVTVIAMMLCIIPALFTTGVFAFVPLIIARKDVSVMEAFTLSWTTLKPHAFPMFALVFVATLLACLGFLGCGIGLLFTAPIPIIVLAMHYRYFFPSQPYAGWQQPVAGPPPTPPFDG